MELLLPALFPLLLLGRKRLQHSLHTRQYQNLVQEFKDKYKNIWTTLSDSQGKKLRWNLVLRYLSRRSLSIAATSTSTPTLNPLRLAQKVHALDLLLTFLRGHVAANGLEVKTSTIPAAGNGLFTTRSFPKGTLLCVYSGTPVSLTQAMRREKQGRHGDYVMGGFGLFWRVDAEPHPKVLARYINDHWLEPQRQNAQFIKLKKERKALVVATRALDAGEEVFASYGEGYWRKRTAKVPPCNSAL